MKIAIIAYLQVPNKRTGRSRNKILGVWLESCLHTLGLAVDWGEIESDPVSTARQRNKNSTGGFAYKRSD